MGGGKHVTADATWLRENILDAAAHFTAMICRRVRK